MMKYLLYLLISITLNGCSTTSLQNHSETTSKVNNNIAFNLVDERPAQQKQSRIVEADHGADAYLGDRELNPNGPNALKTFLQQKFGNKLGGRALALTNFTVEIYKPTASLPYGDADNIFAELIVLGVEKLKSEKTVLVQISGKMNGKSFSSGYSENFKGLVTNNNIRHTINMTLEALAPQIEWILTNK